MMLRRVSARAAARRRACTTHSVADDDVITTQQRATTAASSDDDDISNNNSAAIALLRLLLVSMRASVMKGILIRHGNAGRRHAAKRHDVCLLFSRVSDDVFMMMILTPAAREYEDDDIRTGVKFARAIFILRI